MYMDYLFIHLRKIYINSVLYTVFIHIISDDITLEKIYSSSYSHIRKIVISWCLTSRPDRAWGSSRSLSWVSKLSVP